MRPIALGAQPARQWQTLQSDHDRAGEEAEEERAALVAVLRSMAETIALVQAEIVRLRQLMQMQTASNIPSIPLLPPLSPNNLLMRVNPPRLALAGSFVL
jgi:hypothetical protein